MSSRGSRSKIRTSHSLSRLDSSSFLNGQNKENLYYLCDGLAVSRKSLKDKESISQELVERFVRKTPRARPICFEFYFLEDRIRFKPKVVTLRRNKHPTVAYKDIKGAFSITERPCALVLGIHYPHKKSRKLESFYFPRLEDGNRVKELLLEVKNNPERLLQGVRPIGFVPTGSVYSLSHRSSHLDTEYNDRDLAELSVYSPKPESGENDVQRVDENFDQFYSRATSPIAEPLLLSNSPVLSEPQEENHVFKYRRVNKEVVRPRLTGSMHELGDRVRLPIHQWSERASSLHRYSDQLLLTLAAEQPGSLIFINNTPGKGVHVCDDGPVYMYCQVEQ